MTIDTSLDIATAFTILGGVVAGGRWVWEWSRQSAWERNRFLLEELEDFRHRDTTATVHQLLDWSTSTVHIEDTAILVRDEDLVAALDLHIHRQRFTADELLLRNTLDKYFDDLNTFLYMVRTDLVDEDHLRAALGYWLRILRTGGDKGEGFARALHRYLDYYGWGDLRDFINQI